MENWKLARGGATSRARAGVVLAFAVAVCSLASGCGVSAHSDLSSIGGGPAQATAQAREPYGQRLSSTPFATTQCDCYGVH